MLQYYVVGNYKQKTLTQKTDSQRKEERLPRALRRTYLVRKKILSLTQESIEKRERERETSEIENGRSVPRRRRRCRDRKRILLVVTRRSTLTDCEWRLERDGNCRQARLRLETPLQSRLAHLAHPQQLLLQLQLQKLC